MDRLADATPEPQIFLVERYWPDIDEAHARALAADLERTAAAMAAEGIRVEHVGSILMPRDGVVFSLISASDEAVARLLTARAGAPADRTAVAIRLTDGGRW